MAKQVSDLIVERLIEWGVDTIFGFPGDGVDGFFEALRTHKDKLRFIQVRHEEAAAFAAVGYAKYTGRLGVCCATSGPGRRASSQRPVRREMRSAARARDYRPHLSRSDRHGLPAGRRSRQALYGRLGLQRARHGPGARRQCRRHGGAHRLRAPAASPTSAFPKTSRSGQSPTSIAATPTSRTTAETGACPPLPGQRNRFCSRPPTSSTQARR